MPPTGEAAACACLRYPTMIAMFRWCCRQYREQKTGHAAGFLLSALLDPRQSAMARFGSIALLLSRCVFDSRFINGNTATAIIVQTSAAMPSLLNRLV